MITVYKNEIADGLADQIRSKHSLAYCSQVAKSERVQKFLKSVAKKTDPDLYPIESILVSTGWNKNGDVFLTQPTWEARHTPEDKPLTYEHDATDIIGHITGTWVLDGAGEIVNDNLAFEEVPSEFHIANAAVLYLQKREESLSERMEKIVAEIEEDLWFVSMECLFTHFDYALASESANRIIARNEETSFLTKHLRIYGGTGEYNGNKIGRALRNIIFCGKGLVRSPANPNSVIFKDMTPFTNASIANISDLKEKNVYGTVTIKIMQENDMSESVESMQKTVDELKSAVSALTKERDELRKAIAEIDQKAIQTKVEGFENSIKSKDEEIKVLAGKLEDSIKKFAELEGKLKTSEESAAASKLALETIEKEKRINARKLQLKEKGVDEKEIEKIVAKFDMLSNEDFTIMVSHFASAQPKKETVEGSLDGVDASTDVTLSVDSDGVKNDYSAVAKDICSFLLSDKAYNKVEA